MVPRRVDRFAYACKSHLWHMPCLAFVIAIAVVVVISNVLVQFPLNAFGLQKSLTWGALTYPFSFLIVDLANRRLGAEFARHTVFAGFLCAFPASFAVSGLPTLLSAESSADVPLVMESLAVGLRVALASSLAFLAAQLIDVAIFDALRHVKHWWFAPVLSSLVGSAADTALFFSGAFLGSGLPWVNWAFFDFLIKVGAAGLMLVPYRALSRKTVYPLVS